AFPFTYGAGQVPAAVSLPGLAAPTYSPPPLDVVARFLTFTGVFALAGGVAFGPLVLAGAGGRGAGGGGRRRRGGGAGAGGPVVGRGRAWVQVAALVLSGLPLLSLSLGAHAAAVPVLPALMVAVDWAHVAAAAAWAGGLLQLGLVLARTREHEAVAALV